MRKRPQEASTEVTSVTHPSTHMPMPHSGGEPAMYIHITTAVANSGSPQQHTTIEKKTVLHPLTSSLLFWLLAIFSKPVPQHRQRRVKAPTTIMSVGYEGDVSTAPRQ